MRPLRSIRPPRPPREESGRAGRISGASALGVGAVVLLSACTGTPAESASGSEGSGGTELVVVSNYVPKSFAVDRIATSDVFVNTHATLIKPVTVADESSGQSRQSLTEYEGVLAQSYDVSEDGLTYTFDLRDGVVGSSGAPLDADDVIFSFQRKFNGAGSVLAASFAPELTDPGAQITKVDDSTVAFTVARPGEGAMLLSVLSYIPGSIYDKDVLEAHATPEDPFAMEWTAGLDPAAGNFGFGAYRVSAASDTGYTLEANPDYALGEPEVKKVTYRKVAEGSTRASALQSGDADIAEGLKPFDAEGIQESGAGNAFTFDSMNNILTMDLIVTHAPFDNVAVRKALSYAIPYDKVKSDVYFDRAIDTRGRLDSLAPGYVGDGIEANVYDPEKAKALLTEAGFPDGVKFTLTLSDSQADAEDAAVQIRSAAAAGGFDIAIDKRTSAAFQADSPKGVFDATLVAKSATNASQAYQLQALYQDAPFNWSRWIDPTYLAMVGATLDNPDQSSPEVHQALNEAEQYLVAQQPSIWITRPQPTIAYATGISGVVQRLDPNLDLSTLTVSE